MKIADSAGARCGKVQQMIGEYDTVQELSDETNDNLPSDARLFFDVKVTAPAADRLDNNSVCKYEYEERRVSELVSECRKLAHLIDERSYKGPFEEVSE